MEEVVVRPSVFVVDGQTDIPFTRLGSSPRRQPCSPARLGVGLLLLLMLVGLAVQGWFLLQLHRRLGKMVPPMPVSGARGSRQGGLLCYFCALACRVGDRLRSAWGKLIHLSDTQFLLL